jgi:hypothetical protein
MELLNAECGMRNDEETSLIPNSEFQNPNSDPPSLINQYLSLYFRCRRFKDMQLPSAGGIMDQEEITMQIFEIIHGMVIDYEREQQDDTMKKMQQQSRVTNAKQIGRRGFRK